MYDKTPQDSGGAGFVVGMRRLVLGLCVEAGLVALTAPLADALEHGASCHSTHDGTDDGANRASAIKAARGVEAASDDEAC